MRTIEDLAFVVIARNEEFGLRKCLESVAALSLVDCEVVCIDSGSTDRTIEVMKEYKTLMPYMKVLSINGYSNAAIARNAGIRATSKEFVFFVDGDVELNGEFILVALNHLNSGTDSATGSLREAQYSEGFQTVLRVIEDRFRVKGTETIYASGGCFLTKRSVIETIGLFDERLERSQDYDYTLRITRHHLMKAIPCSMGTHHTIGYDSTNRMRTHLTKLQAVFLGNVLRKNAMNLKGIIWLLTRKERGIMLGGVLLLLGMLASIALGSLGVVAFATLVFVDLAYGIRKKDRLSYRVYLHYVFSILALAGFFYTVDRRRASSVVEIA